MMAKALALNGAKKVYIVGRRLDKLEEAAKESPTGNIIPLQGDVTSKESLEACADHVRKDIGYVNLVICNSGVTGPPHAINMAAGTSAKDLQKQVLATPMEDFTQAFAVNVSGVYYTAFAFLDLLEKGNEKENALEGVTSHVLVTGSIAAYNRSVGAGIAYNTSKAAVTHLVKILAGIFVPYSVRVNAIAPGRKFSNLYQCDHGDWKAYNAKYSLQIFRHRYWQEGVIPHKLVRSPRVLFPLRKLAMNRIWLAQSFIWLPELEHTVPHLSLLWMVDD
jgi:NAD(P)-dependent dehydrogenase (short-subunit alcohol dehydrogenase family)